MRGSEILVYRIRYIVAESIFAVASWVKPPNYEFEAVRAALHLMMEANAHDHYPQENASD